MRIISKDNLCTNRPHINLKKLTLKSSLRVGEVTEDGFKGTYIINQHTQSLCTNQNYTIEYSKGIEKITLDTDILNEKLLVEINYSHRSGAKSAKFKVYLVLDKIKYALPFSSFEDVYSDCMNILARELHGKEELSYIQESYNNLENDDIPIDIELNLERLEEFKDKVDYKRNVVYFVINNIPSATSKYDINTAIKEIVVSDNLKVLRYSYNTRLYDIVEPTDNTNIITLMPTDIICDLSEPNFATVSVYTEYGLGKLLDIKNNVIPNANTLSLFANIIDLGLDVLN